MRVGDDALGRLQTEGEDPEGVQGVRASEDPAGPIAGSFTVCSKSEGSLHSGDESPSPMKGSPAVGDWTIRPRRPSASW